MFLFLYNFIRGHFRTHEKIHAQLLENQLLILKHLHTMAQTFAEFQADLEAQTAQLQTSTDTLLKATQEEADTLKKLEDVMNQQNTIPDALAEAFAKHKSAVGRVKTAADALDAQVPDPATIPDGNGDVTNADGSVTHADGTKTLPDGSVLDKDGNVISGPTK